MASNLQSFGYVQRSTELIDIGNLPVANYTSNAASPTRRNNATPTTATADVINVRQIDISKSTTGGSRVSIGNAKIQRRTSGKMQRPLAYLATHNHADALQTRNHDSNSTAARSKSDVGLLRKRKRSTEQPPPTPGSRSSTFVSHVSINLNSNSALVRRKLSMGGADAGRLDTPDRDRASASVRRHTSLSPRTLKQTRQSVTQRLVVEPDNSDLFVISAATPTQWQSSDSIVVSVLASNSANQTINQQQQQQQHQQQHQHHVYDESVENFDVLVPQNTSSSTSECKQDQSHDVNTHNNDALSYLRLSMADFPSPQADTTTTTTTTTRHKPELSVAQKTLHRSVAALKKSNNKPLFSSESLCSCVGGHE